MDKVEAYWQVQWGKYHGSLLGLRMLVWERCEWILNNNTQISSSGFDGADYRPHIYMRETDTYILDYVADREKGQR